SKEVRLPTGTWIFSHCEALESGGCTSSVPCVYMQYTEYIGARRNTYRLACTVGAGVNGSFPCTSSAPYTSSDIFRMLVSMGYSNIGSFGDAGCTYNCPCYTGIDPYERYVYYWECP